MKAGAAQETHRALFCGVEGSWREGMGARGLQYGAEVPGKRGGDGEKRRKQMWYSPVGAGNDPAYLRHSWSLFF